MTGGRTLVLAAVLAGVCCSPSREVDHPVESVMSEGMEITATTAVGTITVRAGRGYRRTYAWNGCEKSVTLWPRKKRWIGSLGLYYPGPGITWWIPCDGINRAVLGEGQRHFDTVQEATAWLQRRVGFPDVYTSDGLVVEWGAVPGRMQLNVEVWQIYVAGEKPRDLPGSSDSVVSLRYPPGHGTPDG